jgi:bifunctional non-homologous end joining protein LigD
VTEAVAGHENLPDLVRPMLAVAGEVPAGPGWASEFKWDGYRSVAYVEPGRLRLLSRNDLSLLDQFPELQVLSKVVGGRSVVLDGEIVALGPDGRPDFSRLQRRRGRHPGRHTQRSAPVAFYVFDLLHLGDRSLLDQPYQRRRAMLTDLALPGEHQVQVPPMFPDTDPAVVLDVARSYHIEGCVFKRLDSRYLPGPRRSGLWIKHAFRVVQEVVVCGWKPGTGRRFGLFGSLLLGIHTDQGLEFVGHVGAGFTDRALRELQQRLDDLARPASPFTEPVAPREVADVRWVAPVLVGEVEFRQWIVNPDTGTRRLRHPSWRGLRADKAADEVVLDVDPPP